MEWTERIAKIRRTITRYKYPAIILALGLLLMLLPEEKGKQDLATNMPSLEAGTPIGTQLEQILSQMDGVGSVKVLLTEQAGPETIYQSDEDRSDTTSRSQTVTVTTGDRSEEGLVRQVIGPKWQGAVVVCQGADRPAVKLGIVSAVQSVTGISADRITVLKMK